MIATLLTLLAMSNARLLVKLVLLGTTVLVSVCFLRRSLFSTTPIVFLSLLVLLFLPGGDPTAVYIWLACLGMIALLYTLAHRLPVRIILGFLFTLFFAAYVGFLTILAYHSLDPPAFTALLALLYLGWYGCIHDDLRLGLA
jgi:hypothetical protein